MQEYFRQPIVDTFDIRICMSKSIKHSVDFLNDKESDLHEIGTTHSLIHDLRPRSRNVNHHLPCINPLMNPSHCAYDCRVDLPFFLIQFCSFPPNQTFHSNSMYCKRAFVTVWPFGLMWHLTDHHNKYGYQHHR